LTKTGNQDILIATYMGIWQRSAKGQKEKETLESVQMKKLTINRRVLLEV